MQNSTDPRDELASWYQVVQLDLFSPGKTSNSFSLVLAHTLVMRLPFLLAELHSATYLSIYSTDIGSHIILCWAEGPTLQERSCSSGHVATESLGSIIYRSFQHDGAMEKPVEDDSEGPAWV